MDAKWMSRQARWIGCEVAKPAVPLSAISVSIAATISSEARAKSRTERASTCGENGSAASATCAARRSNSSDASRSAAARAMRTWMLVVAASDAPPAALRVFVHSRKCS